MSFTPRVTFPVYNLPLANFKGHHQKALTKFGHIAPQVDVVLEVRDSRAPLSTTNVLFDRILSNKKKIVIYNKNDLSILKPDLLKKWHEFNNEDYLLVDARKRSDAKKITKLMGKVYYDMTPPPPLGLRAMIIGMPNVGKSTLVNTLRDVGYGSTITGAISSKKRKVAKTGGQPGVTRNTSEIIRLSKDPDILVYDTPGVFLPKVKDDKTMLALSLVGCVHTSFIDPVIEADFLLYLLNIQDPSGSNYREYMDHPTNSIYELLHNIALKRNVLKKDGSYDELGMSLHWTNLWKQGKEKKYKCLFDIDAILYNDVNDLRARFKEEKERVQNMKVSDRIADSFGADGTSTAKDRKRTAKNREYDIRNSLFKL